MTFLKGYKTVLFNVVTIVASLAEIANVIDLIAPGTGPMIVLAVSIANLILRYLTTTPIGKNEPDYPL